MASIEGYLGQLLFKYSIILNFFINLKLNLKYNFLRKD